MQITTPEGSLEISDDELTFSPHDDGPVLRVKLNPVPDYHYERGLYGLGVLAIGREVIVLRDEQAAPVIEELRRPRGKSAHKTEPPPK
jgi:hypothetical protein